MRQSTVNIREVNSRSDRSEFIKFAWDHYRGDSNWIPPIVVNQRELLNFKQHPFYETAETKSFLADIDGKTVGRITAIVDHAHNRTHNEKRGMVGFFESVDDNRVASILFETARRWLREKGMNCLRGPLNPAMNYECGLLVDGFDSPPTFLMTYNKPYYRQLFESFGFKKAQDLFAYWGHFEMLQSLDPKLLRIATEAQERFKINVRPSTKKRFDKDVKSFLHIYNRALPGTWGFVPMSDKELSHTAAGLKLLIVPDLVRVAEHEGRPIGAVFGMLDYNPLIKKINGRVFPFGFLRILLERKHLKRIRLISTNVLPEFQRFGLGLVLLHNLLPSVLRWGCTEGEFSWVLESNHLSRASLERGGAKLIKTYRIYDFDAA